MSTQSHLLRRICLGIQGPSLGRNSWTDLLKKTYCWLFPLVTGLTMSAILLNLLSETDPRCTILSGSKWSVKYRCVWVVILKRKSKCHQNGFTVNKDTWNSQIQVKQDYAKSKQWNPLASLTRGVLHNSTIILLNVTKKEQVVSQSKKIALS